MLIIIVVISVIIEIDLPWNFKSAIPIVHIGMHIINMGNLGSKDEKTKKKATTTYNLIV